MMARRHRPWNPTLGDRADFAMRDIKLAPRQRARLRRQIVAEIASAFAEYEKARAEPLPMERARHIGDIET